MELLKMVMLVVSLLSLAASLITVISQALKSGLGGVRAMPGVLFFGLYALTFGLWVVL